MDYVVLTVRDVPDLLQVSGINGVLRTVVNEIMPAFTLILINVNLTHCGRVTQICVFNTVKFGTSASSP